MRFVSLPPARPATEPRGQHDDSADSIVGEAATTAIRLLVKRVDADLRRVEQTLER